MQSLTSTKWPLLLAIALSFFFPRFTFGEFVSSWTASSGQLPTEIVPAWTLSDTASPEDPVLGSQFLTLSTSVDTENMRYIQSSPLLDTTDAFYIEATLRFVSGSTSAATRAPVFIGFTTTANVGNALFINHDSLFFNANEFSNGPVVSVDTNDAFHTYRIDVSATGALSLRYDGNLILTGQTYTSAGNHGAVGRIFWGEGSILATGTSEWKSFQHNALVEDPSPVPLPSSLFLAISALGPIGLLAARLRRSPASRDKQTPIS